MDQANIALNQFRVGVGLFPYVGVFGFDFHACNQRVEGGVNDGLRQGAATGEEFQNPEGRLDVPAIEDRETSDARQDVNVAERPLDPNLLNLFERSQFEARTDVDNRPLHKGNATAGDGVAAAFAQIKAYSVRNAADIESLARSEPKTGEAVRF